MTMVLWAVALVFAGFLLLAGRAGALGRTGMTERWWLYPMQLAGLDEASAPAPAPRVAPRPALQTSAAILAVALALDVSAVCDISGLQFDDEFAAAPAAASLRDDDGPRAWELGATSASWSSSALGSDGWLL